MGRKLLLRVGDVMLPLGEVLAPDDTMRRAVEHLAHQRGLAIVAAGGRLHGVITAGDLSRLAERTADYLGLRVSDLMTPDPKTVSRDDIAAIAVGIMERNGIMVLPVLDPDGGLCGTVHLHDLMRAGAM
jgi:arabinose-5-phosphate isomerase